TRGVDYRLLERTKWDRYLEHDPAVLEFAPRGEGRGRAVPQRLDHDFVGGGARQAGKRPSCLRIREPFQLASDRHKDEHKVIPDGAWVGSAVGVMVLADVALAYQVATHGLP